MVAGVCCNGAFTFVVSRSLSMIERQLLALPKVLHSRRAVIKIKGIPLYFLEGMEHMILQRKGNTIVPTRFSAV